MTKDEALKKAFKQAFQLGQDYWYQADHEFESQNKKSDVTRAKFEQLMEDAIKEALMSGTDGAQPEQEPVAFICEFYADEGHPFVSFEPVTHGTNTPLYTTPPQRKPLSDEEIILIVAECAASHQHTDIHFARAIERAHGIKELV